MCNCNFSNADGGFIDNETPMMSDNGLLDLPFDGYSSADGLDFGSPYGDFEDDVEEKIGRMSRSFDGEAEFGDGEFDDFLTKRSRARRKLRKKLRKSGVSRKEARKEAIKTIPRQKVKQAVKNLATGKTDPETEQLLTNLKSQGVIDDTKGAADVVADQISGALTENTAEGTQNLGTEGMPNATMPTQAGAGGNKMLMFVGIGVVALVGGYFLLRKK